MLDWQERAPALAPAGLVAAGRQARALLLQLQQRDDAGLKGLSLVATRDMLVLLGEAGQLPWLDGVRYCAPDPEAPALWLPTWLRPALPSDLVHAALHRRAAHGRLLLWPTPEHLLPLDGALPIDQPLLAWLAQELAE
jgi:hypothetical protein